MIIIIIRSDSWIDKASHMQNSKKCNGKFVSGLHSYAVNNGCTTTWNFFQDIDHFHKRINIFIGAIINYLANLRANLTILINNIFHSLSAKFQ
ncbi:hypothetical protein CSQ91_09870 [Janthinobacterium sp. BJB301]|nr:hypothetical protein CSQ91_09870 [Janthinobacterium sp. BJB301]